MWAAHPANQDLFEALLCNNLSLAQQALCAGAVAASTIRDRSLLECAIRLRSVKFVELLMRHGARAGDRELRTFCEQVVTSPALDQQASRAIRAIGSVLHQCGADMRNYLEEMAKAQPLWFAGLWTTAHRETVMAPGSRRAPRP